MKSSAIDIPRVARTLLVHRGKPKTELAEVLGVSPSVLSKKLGGRRPWSADDIASMAEFFEVSPALFFEDSRTLIRSVNTPSDPDGGGVSKSITSRNITENYLDDSLLKIAA